MSILTEVLPESVSIGGLKYPIDTDFRTWVLLEELLLDETITQSEKAALALELVYPVPVPPFLIEDALEGIFWFYSLNKGVQRSDSEGQEESTGTAVYSYEHDAEYIYAAFLEQYGIDLTSTDLHWWKFRALLKSLGEDTLFVKIMGYRAMEISADMPAKQKVFYTKMKKLYALPVSRAEEEKANAIEEALLNGGDLSGLL